MIAFPFVAAIVLSFVDGLTKWWGVAILAVSLALSFGAYARSTEFGGGPEELMPFFTITTPAVVAAVIGHFVYQGWGALIAGLVAAALFSVIHGVRMEQSDTAE